ncbi:glycoside hydrolase family 26 protein [Streptomyces vilmorinianum]|uniref:glycoside hydrolase family 26 protein n=1 Tax=Streptomyces vilmorinianum TaxID=3051092 RepID=UPI0015860460|nr:glycosyl hydrolase [Streptomyces vilmorinianum]
MRARHAVPRRWTRTAIALAAVAALAAGIGVWATQADGSDRCAPDARLAPRCGAWWGAYVPYDGDSSLTRPVHAFEKKIGRKLDLVYTYHDMSGNPVDGELLTPDEVELGRERMLMLAWESTVWNEKHHAGWGERQLGWKNIASGTYDASIIDPQARRIKAYGKRVFFSFDQETDFRIREGAGTPEEYVAAYRHLRERFERLGVRNVVWVWTVSGYLGNAAQMKALYPGDAYVDWIGMDQYNYYLCHKSPTWLDFEASQRPSYEWLRANVSATKPVMLSEFSTAPDPRRPARQRDWYAGIPKAAPNLPEARAYVHWNRAVPGENCDLTVNSGPALEGYKEAGSHPYFKQRVPRG